MEGLVAYREECIAGAGSEGAVFDLGLLGEILYILDGGIHPSDGEECSQVSGVGTEDDEGEDVPAHWSTSTQLKLVRQTKGQTYQTQCE